ncbi:hypothetical protein MPDQ_005338 [Monascus purpureus]|uniref:Uncharacterized protein n=1 Tax=Monascus purpureus TaxID=5098 RepID=A0A507QG57_MONPU|nr:hypothetical protein MPDQ_005338 [Monascus purpureus]BDD54382.1 hypothetical protein MAP00_000005 [Monascus purpureus]
MPAIQTQTSTLPPSPQARVEPPQESPESPDLEQVVAGLVTKAPSTPSVWPDGLEPTRVSPFGSSIPIDCPKRCPCEANCAAIFM